MRCLFIGVAPVICGGLSNRYLFNFAVFCVLSSFAIISLGQRERELVAFLLLCSKCHVTVIVL